MNTKKIHQICTLSARINDFFAPLLTEFGFTYTHHTRVYDDGKSFIVNNNPQYLQNFIEKKYALPGPGIYKQDGIHLWSGIKGLHSYDSQVIDMRTNFNIDHQIAIINTKTDYVDIFCLGTTSNRPETVNFYLNHRHIFDNIFLQYMDKFQNDINFLGKDPLAFPLRPKDYVKNQQLANIFSNITKRELECLELLTKGQTAKMVARNLEISHRTVERHIDNIREKLGLKCKIAIANEYREYFKFNTNIGIVHDNK